MVRSTATHGLRARREQRAAATVPQNGGCGHQARHPGTDDDEVVGDGLRDLAFVHRLGRHFKTPGKLFIRVCGHRRGSIAARAGRVRRALRCAPREHRSRRHPHSRHERPFQKTPAIERCSSHRSSLRHAALPNRRRFGPCSRTPAIVSVRGGRCSPSHQMGELGISRRPLAARRTFRYTAYSLRFEAMRQRGSAGRATHS